VSKEFNKGNVRIFNFPKMQKGKVRKTEPSIKGCPFSLQFAFSCFQTLRSVHTTFWAAISEKFRTLPSKLGQN
jgi:hypothetical protein